MRLTRAALPAALAAAAACANMQDPPGGPPRLVPPAIVSSVPDSGAVVANLKGDAVIQFDEVIDEMAGGGMGAGGAVSGLAAQILLSPVAGDVDVSWHRSAIHVHPKEGWKPGRVYRMELLPGIVDLHRNTLKSGRVWIFSTGPAIPTASVAGHALMWVEHKALAKGLIEAVLRPDTVGYLTLTDSVGGFRLDGVPPGRYMVYAVSDQNNDRRLERREAFDSALVTLDSTADVTLWAFVHDSVGPKLRTAEPVDSVTVRLTFTEPLDVTDHVDTARVRLVELPDSTPVRLAAVLTPGAYDSLDARERAAADSARRAAEDTTHHAPADTAKRPAPDTTRRAADTARARADTSALARLLAQRPVPITQLVVRTAAPLPPKTKYFVMVRGARNLNGAAFDAVAVFATPAPKPAADTSRADSAKAPKPR